MKYEKVIKKLKNDYDIINNSLWKDKKKYDRKGWYITLGFLLCLGKIIKIFRVKEC